MPVWKSVQLKAGGRGGGPPCSALEQIVGNNYKKFTMYMDMYRIEIRVSYNHVIMSRAHRSHPPRWNAKELERVCYS